MSVQAISWVLTRSRSKGATRLVAVALANHCDAHGDNAWPSTATIAREAGLTGISKKGKNAGREYIGKNTVRASIRRLEGLGEIEQTGFSEYGTRCFRLVMGRGEQSQPPGAMSDPPKAEVPEIPCDPPGEQSEALEEQSEALGGADVAPEPSNEPSNEPSSEPSCPDDERPDAILSFQSAAELEKKARDAFWEQAVDLLQGLRPEWSPSQRAGVAADYATALEAGQTVDPDSLMTFLEVEEIAESLQEAA